VSHRRQWAPVAVAELAGLAFRCAQPNAHRGRHAGRPRHPRPTRAVRRPRCSTV